MGTFERWLTEIMWGPMAVSLLEEGRGSDFSRQFDRSAAVIKGMPNLVVGLVLGALFLGMLRLLF